MAVGRYRVYGCVSHVKCPFFVRFSRSGGKGCYELTTHCFRHEGVRKGLKGTDRRELKKRRKTHVGRALRMCNTTHHNLDVSPNDVVHTVVNYQEERIPYDSVYKALKAEKGTAVYQECLGYQLIIPYLAEFKRVNQKAYTHYEKEGTRLMHCGEIPGNHNTCNKDSNKKRDWCK